MAKHTYKIASEAGAERYGAELGDTVDLDIKHEEQLAVIAAGWLEHFDKTDHKPAAKPAKEEK